MNSNSIYVIRITGTTLPEIWYHNKIDRDFDAIFKRSHFFVNGNSLFKVYPEDCKVVSEQNKFMYYHKQRNTA